MNENMPDVNHIYPIANCYERMYDESIRVMEQIASNEAQVAWKNFGLLKLIDSGRRFWALPQQWNSLCSELSTLVTKRFPILNRTCGCLSSRLEEVGLRSELRAICVAQETASAPQVQ